MLDRLNPTSVVLSHWRGMRNRDGARSTPDRAVRITLLVVAGGVAALAFWRDLNLESPGVMVSALSLFSAGLLAAFGQLATIRSRFEPPDDPAFDGELDTRNMLDEAVAHILTAALLSATTAVLIVVGMNVSDAPASQVLSSTTLGEMAAPVVLPPAPDLLNSWFSAAVSGAGIYLFLLFVMTVRKLYAAYDVANEVSSDLSGHHR
jgi:hypothetical protein